MSPLRFPYSIPLSFSSFSLSLSLYLSLFLCPLIVVHICLLSLRPSPSPFPLVRPASYVSHPLRGSSNTGLPRWSATKHRLIKNENAAEMRVEMRSRTRKKSQSALEGSWRKTRNNILRDSRLSSLVRTRETNRTIYNNLISTAKFKTIIILQLQEFYNAIYNDEMRLKQIPA